MTPPNDAAPLAGGAEPNESTSLNRTPAAEIERFLRAIVQPDEVFEVRVLNCLARRGSAFTSTVSGYYQHAQVAKAAADIAALDASGRAPVIYVTLNPVAPVLLARAQNRLKEKARETTTDKEVVRRCWMLIDCDPVRPAGISATEAELRAAGERAQAVRLFLTGLGWPEPVAVMSGNGVHLLYRIDLPADDGGVVERILNTLTDQFDDERVKIDRSVHNAARITKVAGTTAGNKGDDMVGVEGLAALWARTERLREAYKLLRNANQRVEKRIGVAMLGVFVGYGLVFAALVVYLLAIKDA